MKPTILFEDEFILVLDKPAGITVNRSETTVGVETVQDWLEKEGKISLHDISKETDFFKRTGIVHRIDKETSGILLVAKDENSFLELQRQFKERLVKKSYVALVHGEIKVQSGEINVPVGRLPWNRKQFGIIAGGRDSITEYTVLSIKYLVSNGKKEPLTLVQLSPQTGRTHQIRVHLKYFGHPIFADFLYGGRKTSREDRKILGRVFLHAAKIQFQHPATGESISFESPLPAELSKFLNALE